MKKTLAALLAFSSLATFAADTPTIDELSKKDVENVGNEFAVNFSHTTVAAPETEGVWGVEVGLIGGSTSSPKLKDVVSENSDNGDDFKKIYHAGIMARAHLPWDLFAEFSILPERKVSEVTVENKTFGVGWNAGAFFNWPLDVAIGANFSDSHVSFKQDVVNGVAIQSKINVDASSQILWLGVSKKIAFFTPYAKIGLAKTEAEVKSSAGSIFTDTTSNKQSASVDGGYLAVGANVQFFFFRLGVEGSQTNDVKRASAKLSVAF